MMLTASRPMPLWKFAVVVEVRLWVCLFRWIARQPPRLAEGERAFGYTKAAMPVIWVFIFVSIIEIPAIHILTPWESVRIVLLIVSVWGLEWMFGFVASLKLNPHAIGPTGIRLRNGATLDLTVPWELIASIRPVREFPESRRLLAETEDLSPTCHKRLAIHRVVDSGHAIAAKFASLGLIFRPIDRGDLLTTTIGNTGYTGGMAKVMVSLPDDLLRAVDVEAERRGTTRSGLLRELAEQTLRQRSKHRAKRIKQIGAGYPLTARGGNVADLVKANRPEQ